MVLAIETGERGPTVNVTLQDFPAEARLFHPLANCRHPLLVTEVESHLTTGFSKLDEFGHHSVV